MTWTEEVEGFRRKGVPYSWVRRHWEPAKSETPPVLLIFIVYSLVSVLGPGHLSRCLWGVLGGLYISPELFGRVLSLEPGSEDTGRLYHRSSGEAEDGKKEDRDGSPLDIRGFRRISVHHKPVTCMFPGSLSNYKNTWVGTFYSKPTKELQRCISVTVT